MLAHAACTLRTRPDRRLDLLRTMMRDYRRTPQLSPTAGQASRLWAVQQDTCDQLLACLVDDGFLDKRPDGRLVMRDRAFPIVIDNACATIGLM
jgi:hypothetical protein